jgi:hypothetical protein
MDSGLLVVLSMVRARLCHSMRNLHDNIHLFIESLWDNPDFIKAVFHVVPFVMVAVDTEAGQENINALYSSLKTTLAQIDVSARQPPLLHLLNMDLILSLCR